MTKEITIKDNRIKELLTELEIRLRELFKDDHKKIILFGSYAKGNYGNESDIDIMVLLGKHGTNDFEDQIADIVVDLTGKYSIYISIFIENEKLYYKNINLEALFKNIENEGIELYAAWRKTKSLKV